jgi:hypothetical protein
MTCGRGPFEVTDIQIGRAGVGLSAGVDGSLQFMDLVSGTVKLSDLINQEIIVNPAVVIEVEEADWTPIVMDDGRTFYTVDVPHNFNVTNFALVDVVIWDTSYNMLSIDNIQQKANSALLRSIIPLHIYVTAKKI